MEINIEQNYVEIEAKVSKAYSCGWISKQGSRAKSSVSSAASRKEKLALSKLNLEYVKKKHGISRKFDELKYAQELLEGEMELQRAQVSHEVGEEENLKPLKLFRDGSVCGATTSEPVKERVEHFDPNATQRTVESAWVDNVDSVSCNGGVEQREENVKNCGPQESQGEVLGTSQVEKCSHMVTSLSQDTREGHALANNTNC